MPIRDLDPAAVFRLRSLQVTDGPVVDVEGSPPARFRRLHVAQSLDRRDFDAAAEALLGWRMHAEAGLDMRASDAPLCVGSVVLMRRGWRALALRIPCRVVDVVHEADRVGFTYATLAGHPEAGQERFLLERDASGRIMFTITAVSRPAWPIARCAGPLSRWLQMVMTKRYVAAMDRA